MTQRLYLVTGGAGFIGSHVARHLLDLGHQVRVLDNMSTGLVSNLPPRAELLRGSVLDQRALDAAFEGVDGVIHLAARISVNESWDDVSGYAETNIVGTSRLLDAARRAGVTQVVGASSCAVYGLSPTVPDDGLHEDADLAPGSPYAWTKLALEQLFKLAAEHSPGSYTALRFFNVFGERQRADGGYAAVLPAFVSAAKQGRPLVIHGDGGQTRDFVPVSVVAQACAAALADTTPGFRPVNVCTGQAVSILDLASSVWDCALELLPSVPAVQHTEAREGDVRRSLGNTERLRRGLRVNAGDQVLDEVRAFVRASFTA